MTRPYRTAGECEAPFWQFPLRPAVARGVSEAQDLDRAPHLRPM